MPGPFNPFELDLGRLVDLETPEGRRDATIAPLPFFDPEKQIPKS